MDTRQKCIHYLRGYCKFGNKCKNLHHSVKFIEPKVCDNYARGYCQFGARCKFTHVQTPQLQESFENTISFEIVPVESNSLFLI